MSEPIADQLTATVLNGGNADFIEDLYRQFLRDPQAVEPSWARYFNNLPAPGAAEAVQRQFREPSAARLRIAGAESAPRPPSEAASAKQGAVSRLIQIYANRGHLIAHLDPLGLQERPKPYVLELQYYGLSDADLETEFFT